MELFGKLDLGSILEIGTSNNKQKRGILRTVCSEANSQQQVSLFCHQIVDNLSETLY